jgi:hypothetical protein
MLEKLVLTTPVIRSLFSCYYVVVSATCDNGPAGFRTHLRAEKLAVFRIPLGQDRAHTTLHQAHRLPGERLIQQCQCLNMFAAVTVPCS